MRKFFIHFLSRIYINFHIFLYLSQSKETDTGLSKLINFTNEEEEVVRKAFVRDFRDPSDLSKRFMFFINKCLREYETTKDYYAPYTTLIQASGTGKSKLLM